MDRRRSSHHSKSHTPRYRDSERGHRRLSRSISRSRSHSIPDYPLPSKDTRKARTREDRRSPSVSRERYPHQGSRIDYQQRSRSPSTSRDHYSHRGTRYVRDHTHRGDRRSRSRSVDGSRWGMSRRQRSPSPHRRSFHTRQRSPSLRSFESHPSDHRSRNSYRRSQSPRGRSPTPRRFSPSSSHFVERRSPSFRRSRSTCRRSPSLHERHSTPSPCDRSAHSRNRSSSVRRPSRSPRRHRISRSRSVSRRRRDASATLQSESVRGPSRSPNHDTRYAEVELLQTSSQNILLKSGSDGSTDAKHDVKTITKVESKGTDEPSISVTESFENSSTFHGYSHHHLLSNPSHDDRVTSSSPAPHGSSPPAKPITILNRVTESSPRSGLSSTPTLTQPTSGNGSHRLINPILEKRYEALRESHRAYLKSRSDYNRAEMKYVSIEAELRLAEFWLGVVTKNLEDVGKRIEIHDWNFQKITNQDGSDVA